jgi:hypothetical protein
MENEVGNDIGISNGFKSSPPQFSNRCQCCGSRAMWNGRYCVLHVKNKSLAFVFLHPQIKTGLRGGIERNLSVSRFVCSDDDALAFQIYIGLAECDKFGRAESSVKQDVEKQLVLSTKAFGKELSRWCVDVIHNSQCWLLN